MRLPRTALNMGYVIECFLLALCLEVILYTGLVSGGDVISPSGYLWRTGDWGKCQGAQCGFGGTQSRYKWCEHTEGWTAKESDCDLLSMPQGERTCFKVCAEHAELFEWQVEEWGPCQRNNEVDMEIDSPTSTDHTCGDESLGTQYRNVKCVEKTTSYVQRPHESFVDSEVCRELHPEPVVSQECITPCAQDCVLTVFTPWTYCTSTCGNGTQTRTRQVAIPPSRGGKACPPLSETQVCEDIPPCNGEQDFTYSIKIGPWSECTRIQEDPDVRLGSQGLPLIGMQNREIWCIQSDGAGVRLEKCFADEYAIIPPRYQACVVAQNCIISEWSEWSPCPVVCPLPYGSTPGVRHTAVTLRRRQVTALPLGGGDLCPHLEEKKPCREEDVTASTEDCSRYTWHTGGWSECSVAAVMSQHQFILYADNRTLCGEGLYLRQVYCTKLNSTDLLPESDYLCEAATKPVSSDACSVECPKDCKVSGWGQWSECKTTSCSPQSYKREKGHKIRTRDVLVQSDIGGQACPPLAEFVPCDIHVCYDWSTQPEGDCILHTSTSCGVGIQQLDVTCIGPDKEPVADNLCTSISLEEPIGEQTCSIPCPDDCVISDWSDWSECSQSCGKGGIETRRRTVLARNKEGALSCPPEDDLTETRLCNSHSCVVFAWLASDWTTCQSVNSAPYHIPNHLIEGITCGIGRQTRTLQCVRVGNFKISPMKRCSKLNKLPVSRQCDIQCPVDCEVSPLTSSAYSLFFRCSDMNKPPVSQQCDIPCPVDCEVSPFGKWSACPDACPQSKGEDLYQTRQRYILQHPRHGGTACPSLVEKNACLIKEHCHTYEWLPSNWGLCKPVSGHNGQPRENAEGQECGMGLMTRELECQRADGYPVVVDLCLRYSSPMQEASKPCHLPCDEDCNITEWAKWTDCPNNCSGDQVRRRRLKGKSRRLAECTKNYHLIERRMCSCPTYNLAPIGTESDCILTPKTRVPNSLCARGYRALGLRYRAQVCYDQEQRIMPFSYCDSDKEYVETVCDIPCPYDCHLSSWSQWSECSQIEGIGEQIRRRQIIEGPHNGGRPCPGHNGEGWLYETKPCQLFNASEVAFYWNAEMWQECRLDVTVASKNATCGVGFQRRTVRCIMVSPTGFMGWTNHTMCEVETKPEDIRECIKPCSGDCVVGEWGEWSRCPENCNQVSFRHCTREVVRHPPEAEEDLCPALMQQEQCMMGINCFEYAWNVTHWSTCELKPSSVCGTGKMIRILQCKERNGAGNVVDKSHCEQTLKPYIFPLELKCHVGCPIDCQLSQWSEWTKCSDVCGPDVGQSRTRQVQQEAVGLGRPCSTKLQQWRPCKVMPCFHWIMSEWSDCQALDGHCGVGMRIRNLTCTQNDGMVVEDKYCIGKIPYSSNLNVTIVGAKLLERQQICTIPCPGECQHTQWSSWSTCHIYCYEGNPIGSEGIEARSKAALESYQGIDCPGDKIETRPCTGDTCHRFRWEMGPWTLGHRNVWCQRSDGLNVTGACFKDEEPSSEAKCDPACLVEHSYCSQHAECACMKEYQAQYSVSTGELEECEDPEWLKDVDKTTEESTGAQYREADGSGEDKEKAKENTKEKSATMNENPKPSDSKKNKANEEKSKAEKNVFGHIPVWAFAIGGVFVIFILCLVIAFCCACRSCRKKEDPKKREPTDDFAIYWDESAKKRYNGDDL